MPCGSWVQYSLYQSSFHVSLPDICSIFDPKEYAVANKSIAAKTVMLIKRKYVTPEIFWSDISGQQNTYFACHKYFVAISLTDCVLLFIDTQEPIGQLSLKDSVTTEVGLVSRDKCARPNTIELVIVRPLSKADNNTDSMNRQIRDRMVYEQ